jgi:hypothetical protein
MVSEVPKMLSKKRYKSRRSRTSTYHPGIFQEWSEQTRTIICDSQAEIRNGYLTNTILQRDVSKIMLGYNNIGYGYT